MKKMILFFTLVLTINLFSNTSYDEFFQKVEILKEKIKNGDKKAINNLGNLYANNENSLNIPK